MFSKRSALPSDSIYTLSLLVTVLIRRTHSPMLPQTTVPETVGTRSNLKMRR